MARGRGTIDVCLLPELFRFKRDIPDDLETHGYLEQKLLNPMSQIVTSQVPLLTAAQINTQVEFDRTYRTLVKADGYWGKQVVLISGLNINIMMFRNMKYGGGSELVASTKLACNIILKDAEHLIGLTLANQGNAYVMVTGIQLNGSKQQE